MLFEQLKSFSLAAKYSNFSQAARELNLTQSAVTHQIKALEDTFGVKLYERLRRGIQVTPEGEKLVEYAKTILMHVKDMEEFFRTHREGSEVEISIAAHRGIVRFTLPDVIKAFRMRYPDANFVIYNRVMDDGIISLVLSGEVDFGILTSWNVFENLHFHEFVNYDMFLCVSPELKATRSDINWENISLREIGTIPLILYERENPIRKRIDSVFAKEGIQCDVIIETGGPEILHEYARIGLGGTIISGLAFYHENYKDITPISVSQFFGKLGYGVIFRKDKYFSAALTDFLTILDPQLIVSDLR